MLSLKGQSESFSGMAWSGGRAEGRMKGSCRSRAQDSCPPSSGRPPHCPQRKLFENMDSAKLKIIDTKSQILAS